MTGAPWPKLMSAGFAFCLGISLFAATMVGCSATTTTEAPAAGATAAAPAGSGQVTEFKKNGKLFCPLMKVEMASADEAEGFVDHEGVRYYVCCGMCLKKAQADPASVAKAAAAL